MKKEAMQNQTRLILRGSTYHFRAKVPADLRGSLEQKHEVVRSLRTKDKREAERLARIESVKLDAEWQRLRDESGIVRTEITDDEIQRLVALTVAVRMGADEIGRVAGISEEAFKERERTLERAEEIGRKAVARGDFSGEPAGVQRSISDIAGDWLAYYGFKLPRDSEGYRKFTYEFAKASLEATGALKRRQLGDPVVTPVAPPFPHGGLTGATQGDSVETLLQYWKDQAPRKPKTAHEFTTAVRRFTELHGKMPAAQIQKRHVVAFKDKLVADGLARGTIVKQLGALSAVIQLAVDNDKLPLNPVRGVRLPKGRLEKKARMPFDKEDLRKIFNAGVFTEGERPKAGAGDAAYWLPLIALFTGARMSEIGQLRVNDIRVEDGIKYFNITDEGEDSDIKTESSRRRVPIHPELIRLGFLNYVAGVSKGGAERLFPDIKTDRMGVLTGNWSKWWGRYMRKTIGITDKRKVFHSFRHTFKDACRAAGIGQEIHDALTGHADGHNEGRSYGAEPHPLRPLADDIRKVRYAGLKL